MAGTNEVSGFEAGATLSSAIPGIVHSGFVDERRSVALPRWSRARALAVLPLVLFGFLLASCSTGSPAPTPRPPTPAPTSATPSGSALASLPIPGQAPPTALTLVQVTEGTGSTTLPTIVPQGTLYIEISCVGTGSLSVASADNLVGVVIELCVGPGTTVQVPSEASDLPRFVGNPLTLRLTGAPGLRWRIYVAGSSTGSGG